jgi:putative phosphoribosyl transferase
MGAIASNGVRVLTRDIIDEIGIADEAIEQVTAVEREELARRERVYRGDGPAPALSHRIVILVDDGLATGATMEAAVVAARASGPARIVVAAPVGAPETCARLAAIADEVVCVETPQFFQAVGLWYDRFDQTSDEEVLAILGRGRTP